MDASGKARPEALDILVAASCWFALKEALKEGESVRVTFARMQELESDARPDVERELTALVAG